MDDGHPHRRRAFDEVRGAALSGRSATIPDREDHVGIFKNDDADAVIGVRPRPAPAREDQHLVRGRDQAAILVARGLLDEIRGVFLDRKGQRDRKRDAGVDCRQRRVAVGALGEGREQHRPRRLRREDLGVLRPRRLGGGLHRGEHRSDVGGDSRPRSLRDAVRPVADDADGEGKWWADGRLHHDGWEPLRYCLRYPEPRLPLRGGIRDTQQTRFCRGGGLRECLRFEICRP